MPAAHPFSNNISAAGRSEDRSTSLPRNGSADGSQRANSSPDVLMFRDYTLVPKSRQLRRNSQDIEIGGRAFDLLTLLVSARGELVTKEQILAYVWPSMIVEESNLRFQMTNLRKVLGADRELIKTVPGRGYIFVVDDEMEQSSDMIETLSHRFSDEVARTTERQGSYCQSDDSVTSQCEAAPDVVLIDDDESVREALCGLIDFMGLTVEAHRSVQAFLETQPRVEPKCLILDVLLPGRSGLDFQADLLKSHSETPVIFISGHADVHMSVRAMKAGAVDFLTKPLRHEELLAAVQSAVQRDSKLAFA